MTRYGCCANIDSDATNTLLCIDCKINFHLECVLPTTVSTAVSEDFKSTWVCPSCTNKESKNDDTPVRLGAQVRPKRGANKNPGSSNPESTVTKKIQKDIAKFVNIKSNIKPNDFSLDTSIKDYIREEMDRLRKDITASFKSTIDNLVTSEISSIREDLVGIKNSMIFINEKFEDFNKKLNDVDTRLKSCEEVCCKIETLESALNQIQCDANSRDQWARRSNIEIIGIPEKRNENLFDLIGKLADRADFKIMATDIDFVTRVAPSNHDNKQIKPIIVRFLSRYRKDAFLYSLKKLKGLHSRDLGFTDTNGDRLIFFNDHLTKLNKFLLQRAKKMASEKCYKYVWVKNCSIMLRKTDSSKIIHIAHSTDLNKIV